MVNKFTGHCDVRIKCPTCKTVEFLYISKTLWGTVKPKILNAINKSVIDF